MCDELNVVEDLESCSGSRLEAKFVLCEKFFEISISIVVVDKH